VNRSLLNGNITKCGNEPFKGWTRVHTFFANSEDPDHEEPSDQRFTLFDIYE